MIRTSLQRILNLAARCLATLLVLAGIAGLLNTPVLAQNNRFIELGSPDTSSYPDLTVNFRLFNTSGKFVKNLDIANVHLVENGQVITPDNLDMLEPGVRLIVAINEYPKLANRYATISRIEKIKSALTSWADSLPITTMDDFSLVTNSGVLASQLTDPADWMAFLESYQPDLPKTQPGLTSLSSALDLAAASGQSNQKTTAILYITPMPEENENPGLADLISQAKLANVRLFIWLVGPETYALEEQADQLRQAAQDTQGQFLLFTGPEDLPDLSTYFDPLTYVYRAEYHSGIKSSGDFSLLLRINQDDAILESDTVTFTLNAMAPNPIFLSPPAVIERTWTETERKRDSVLIPNTFPLQLLIEFPDGMERDLVYSRLFVDDRMVDENITPPFDQFVWDISEFNESGSHTIIASIEDEAGFIVETVGLPVEVTIPQKPQTWLEKLFSAFSAQSIFLFLIILTAGSLLVLMAVRSIRLNRKTKQAKTHRLEDPLTQPVIIENEIIHPRVKPANQSHWPSIPGSGLAPARLLLQSAPLSDVELPGEIAISDTPAVFGSDAKKAKIIFPTAAVSPLHARIIQEDQDLFKIFDEGSGSGTWLNFAPVSQYGAKLEHGDQIHFGPIVYRFEIYGSQPHKFKVEPFKEME